MTASQEPGTTPLTGASQEPGTPRGLARFGVAGEQLLFWLLLALWVLNVADLLLTHYVLWLGFATEENGVMRYFLHEGTLRRDGLQDRHRERGRAAALARAPPPGGAGRGRSAGRRLRRRRGLPGGLGDQPLTLSQAAPAAGAAAPAAVRITAQNRAQARNGSHILTFRRSTLRLCPGILHSVLPVDRRSQRNPHPAACLPTARRRLYGQG